MHSLTLSKYGRRPEIISRIDLRFTEYMHFMYLPIRMPGAENAYDIRVPKSLTFALPAVIRAIHEEEEVSAGFQYVYLTARRGYATPGNPLNRPGWHSDGFGTRDVNYVWTDRFPTEFAIQEFRNISGDHVLSLKQFEQQIDPALVATFDDCLLMRLDDRVIHRAPEIPAPGGERSFLKVSFSNERYDLLGNSHNHLFDYQWTMHDRASVRNDPASAGKDHS